MGSSGGADASRAVVRLERAAAVARRSVLRMLEAHPAGHVGGALSAIDAVTALYLHTLRFDPADPGAPGRDRFLLSAGHKALAQYAVLALAGVIPIETLDTYGHLGSPLPGHPDMHKLPGIEANTGALGHGLPIACGMALGARMDGLDSRVFVLMGDGELPEGSNWEGAAIAAHHRLDNLVVLVDANGRQISGETAQVMDMTPIAARFAAFGWATTEVDGHDMTQLVDALDAVPFTPGRPSLVVLHTVKGKGVAAIEGTTASHYWRPTPSELRAAIAETEDAIARLDVAGDATRLGTEAVR